MARFAQNRQLVLLLWLLLLLPFLSAHAAAAQEQRPGASGPIVLKVDPPNWWTGFTPGLMLLISGQGLQPSRVTTEYPGVHVSRMETEPKGHHMFLWLEISPSATPGDVPLRIWTAMGETTFRLSLLARQPQKGRFQGLTRDDVIYLIMPDRFADGDPSNDQPPQSPGTYDRKLARAYHGGDLRGIRDHLDYLQDLGITTLWLNPIYDNDNHSPNDYHGYGAVDFYAVDEHLGTVGEFQDLVSAAHRRGMKVLLDVVVNHSGPRHPWMEDPPATDWFHGTPAGHTESRGGIEPVTDPHALLEQYRDFLDGWFANILPDLNQENPLVSEYLIENNLWWAEISGLDGFRLDTFPYVPRSFWSEWHQALFAQYPHLVTIGEVFNADPTVTAFFVGGRPQFDGIDSRLPTIFDFPLYFALRDVVLRDRPVGRLLEVLRRDWLYPHPESLVTFIGNHDVVRILTAAGASIEKVKLAFSLLVTLRGIPQIYSGDEIAMPGGEDPDNRRDFPGGFPGDPRNAFTATGRTSGEQDVFRHVQALLRLRHEHPALREGHQWHIQSDSTSYVFLREVPGDKILTVFNNAAQPRTFDLRRKEILILGVVKKLGPLLGAPAATLSGDRIHIEALPRSVSIYSVQ